MACAGRTGPGVLSKPRFISCVQKDPKGISMVFPSNTGLRQNALGIDGVTVLLQVSGRNRVAPCVSWVSQELD